MCWLCMIICMRGIVSEIVLIWAVAQHHGESRQVVHPKSPAGTKSAPFINNVSGCSVIDTKDRFCVSYQIVSHNWPHQNCMWLPLTAECSVSWLPRLNWTLIVDGLVRASMWCRWFLLNRSGMGVVIQNELSNSVASGTLFTCGAATSQDGTSDNFLFSLAAAFSRVIYYWLLFLQLAPILLVMQLWSTISAHQRTFAHKPGAYHSSNESFARWSCLRIFCVVIGSRKHFKPRLNQYKFIILSPPYQGIQGMVG